MQIKEEFMLKAIEAAKESAINGCLPIGAVIVKDDKIISVSQKITKNDPVNHAEIDAIRKACRALNQPYLEDCILYSTHEPCPMCASASVWAKINTIVYGVSREEMLKHKNYWQIDIPCEQILNKGSPKITLVPNFLKDECLKLFSHQ